MKNLIIAVMALAITCWAIPKPMESVENYNVLMVHGAYGAVKGFENSASAYLTDSQKSFSGNIGIHLKNWNDFDKNLLGLVVVDENGEILWGSPWNGSGVILAQEYANVQR